MNALLYNYLVAMNGFKDEEGQDLVEYALLLGLIALAAVVAIITVGGDIRTIWGNVSTAVTNAAALAVP